MTKDRNDQLQWKGVNWLKVERNKHQFDHIFGQSVDCLKYVMHLVQLYIIVDVNVLLNNPMFVRKYTRIFSKTILCLVSCRFDFVEVLPYCFSSFVVACVQILFLSLRKFLRVESVISH